MKIFATGIVASLVAMTPASASEAIDLDWLAGAWCSEGASNSEEHWLRREGGLMLAMSRTVTKKGTEFEFVRIEFDAKGARYIAQPSGGPATVFELVNAAPNQVTFANPQHDFPKRIRYTRQGDSLIARIDAGTDDSRHREFRWTPCPTGTSIHP
jgi:hypothetical protein